LFNHQRFAFNEFAFVIQFKYKSYKSFWPYFDIVLVYNWPFLQRNIIFTSILGLAFSAF